MTRPIDPDPDQIALRLVTTLIVAIGLAVLLVLLTGCASAPTRDDVRAVHLRLAAEHGPRFEEWPAEAQAEFRAILGRYRSGNASSAK